MPPPRFFFLFLLLYSNSVTVHLILHFVKRRQYKIKFPREMPRSKKATEFTQWPKQRWCKFIIRQRSDYKIGFIASSIGPNISRKLTRVIAPAHNISGKVWMKKNIHGFTYDNCLSVKPCILFFIQTLPGILWASAISRVNFLDLFGPIAGAINPVM